MDNKTYNKNEDEYQFQEPETKTPFSPASNRSSEVPSIFERINRQSIIAGLMFIFLAFGAYKLLSGLFHTVHKQSVAAKVVQQPPESVAASKQPTTLPAVDPTVSRLDHLAKGQSDVQTSVHSLNSEVSDIQATLAQLNTQLTQVSNEVQSLHEGQETLIQNQVKAVKKTTEKKAAAPKAIYYVRAIIPGRVWLTTQEGTTLTLGIGDNLAGYGVLESINADQGIVTFSSGAVIGYAPNDR